jgi:hypothetical protein
VVTVDHKVIAFPWLRVKCWDCTTMPGNDNNTSHQDDTAFGPYGRKAHDHLLRRVEWWTIEAAIYRGLNIVLFLLFKVSVAVMSAVVAVNLTLITRGGDPLVSNTWMAVVTGAILLVTALDILMNPTNKKVLAFQLHLDMSLLKERVYLELEMAPSKEQRLAILEKAAEKAHALLSEYAKRGFGN